MFCVNTCFQHLYKYLGVELLAHIVTPCLNFGVTVKLFSTLLHSHQQDTRAPISKHSSQYLNVVIAQILIGLVFFCEC